jgi:hypothetical protein
VAVALTVTVPLTVAPAPGEEMETAGGVVSPLPLPVQAPMLVQG